MKIQRKQWLYFILTATNQSITWDRLAQKPVLNSSIDPRFLNDNPSGWQDIEISAATNQKYFSLNRQFATSLKFIGDGANVLRYYCYNGRGYDNDLYVLILQWNEVTGNNDVAYKGKLDFTSFSDDIESGVSMDTKEGGVLEYLNSNDGIEEQILCDETNPAAFKIKFDGITLADSYIYANYEGEVAAVNYYLMPLFFQKNEGDSVGVLKGESIPLDIVPAGASVPTSKAYFEDSENYLFKSVYPLTGVRIKGVFKYKTTEWNTFLVTQENYGQLLFIATDKHYTFSNSFPDNQFYPLNFTLGDPTPVVPFAPPNQFGEIPFDITLDLEANEKVFLVMDMRENIDGSATTNGTNTIIPQLDGNLSISFNTITPPSLAYAITWYDWYKQMVLKISDNKYTGESDFLKSRPDLCVTCGDALRNSDRTIVKNYFIASSFQDGFKSMSAKLDLALDIINGVLYIEPKTTIYNYVSPKIFELGEISDVFIEVATELLINDILCGFPDQQYDERNGKYEFNSQQEWKAPVTLPAQKPLDIKSVWRGDAFGIEFIRANFTKLDTTDNVGDKQAFMVQVRVEEVANVAEVIAVKFAESLVVSGDVVYDQVNNLGGAEAYIIPDISKSEFTYIYAQSYTVQILANLYGNISGSGDAVFELRLNGVAILSRTVNAAEVFFRVDFSIPQNLVQNDVITLNVNVGSTSIDFTSGGITFEISGVTIVPEYILWRDNYDSISGVLDNTVFNVNFSPHRDILAHSAYLSGLLNQMALDSLILTSSAKNVELSTTLNGVTITEKDPIPINTLFPALFLPYYCKFKCKPQHTFLKTIVAINGGYIHATYNGSDLYLLPIGEMSAKPAINQVQEWRLLLAPNNILSNLLKLSQAGLYLNYMDNLIFISDLNPVHFVKYDFIPYAKYHHLDMYDEWVKNRNDRYGTNPNYIQRWQVGDEIKFQFITANIGQLQLDVKDCDGNTIETVVTSQVVDAAVQNPYMLQQATITGLSVGLYYIILSYGGTVLAISEAQKFSTVEKAYLFEYSSTYNVLYGYFSNWKPYLRCDAMLMQWQPESDFENYEDDPGDVELINARTSRFRNLILGTNDGIGGSGLPDFMMNKMNLLTTLNYWKVEGEHYTRSTDSKIEPTQRNGNPFDFYTVKVQKAISEKGLSLSGFIPATQTGIISYTFDATGFGMQEGIIIAQIQDE
jgi:hypothetical protein